LENALLAVKTAKFSSLGEDLVRMAKLCGPKGARAALPLISWPRRQRLTAEAEFSRQESVTMPDSTLDAPEVLNREFLEIRARLIQVAALLDRLDRASGDVSGDPRVTNIRQAIDVLANRGDGRAEKLQLIFSRQYEAEWKSKFELKS
jgi:hypothetical protein